MSDQTWAEIEYKRLMKMAKDYGLCPNCFHTYECCNDECKFDTDMLHVCDRASD